MLPLKEQYEIALWILGKNLDGTVSNTRLPPLWITSTSNHYGEVLGVFLRPGSDLQPYDWRLDEERWNRDLQRRDAWVLPLTRNFGSRKGRVVLVAKETEAAKELRKAGRNVSE